MSSKMRCASAAISRLALTTRGTSTGSVTRHIQAPREPVGDVSTERRACSCMGPSDDHFPFRPTRGSMRAFQRQTSVHHPAGAVSVARWEQFGVDPSMPFGAMWYSVPPGETSPLDVHPERELSLVVSGTADVESGG